MISKPYNVYYCKKQNCRPGHEVGLMTRDHFLIHFVIKGCGVFQTERKTYTISEGQCFIIFPNSPAGYKADEKNPWSYSWIGFNGPDLMNTFSSWGLTADSPVLTFDESCRAFYYIDEIIENQNNYPGSQWRIMGNLLKIIGELERFATSDNPTDIDDHIRKSLLFIEKNYTQPIGVSDIVSDVCLERSYFSNLFKNKMGKNPRDYLQKYRMSKAMDLLISTSYSIEIVARSVGFKDPLHFSRNFKKYTGNTPTEFRKKRH
ncbi:MULTISPECIES: AraC family transcriptional regulator [unclassified Oceanispirochaeta]|uniref:AraC family transcriptional regulator n=1 Tax=unclassified Oceanispirochaeta TaxID=2635722 RepID=UPI000E09B085|nr:MULTISPECIES: AraC family transcriptional regulator [unclassified Oceanispirochaeta]MBF9018638.1 AraC family transcriptional regulator [Oceanispirochaeta sp. M2]NPD75075.1 AraC family transcriptional regulator [Oceanispirochaeta sp. M1]RDG29062.1 AraC family transcriptional regulator [Oceanispirochaeta sp. M1]